MGIISSTAFTHGDDHLSWQWNSTGQFSVKSVYIFFNFRVIKKRQTFTLVEIASPQNKSIYVAVT